MYISDENRNLKLAPEGAEAFNEFERREYGSEYRDLLIYSLVTVFVALFGAVYEAFSHEVYSYFMIYAFGIPLILGIVPELIFCTFNKKRPPAGATISWNCGVAALTVGSIFQGVLDIYGTTNRLIIVYPITGAVMLTIGAILIFRKKFWESAEETLK